MANKFDKLEKFFFSKRKGVGLSGENATKSSTVPSSPTDRQFPSPSFIRPKASRMAAREEIRYKYPDTKFPTVEEPNLPQRHGSVDSRQLSTEPASHPWKHTRLRSSSLDSDHSRQVYTSFDEHSFEKLSIRCGQVSPFEMVSKPLSVSSAGAASGTSAKPGQDFLARLYTPPSSDAETGHSPKNQPSHSGVVAQPFKSLPTPECSPEMGPLPDWEVLSSQTIDILNQDLFDDIQRKLEEPMAASSGASVFQTSPSQPSGFCSPNSSFSNFSLQEPEVDDFYKLSDENVAESYVPASQFSSSSHKSYSSATLAPSILSLPLRDPPLLTLEQPSTSRPATVAAFEAARIASRYNFDMLYIVNLWPEDESPASAHHLLTGGNMSGRLLAAYGLDHGPSPFQISSEVHMKILQSSGWVEYLDEQAENDFACAYAHTFYPCFAASKRSSGSSQSTQSTNTALVDRGIVFAAYRKRATQDASQHPTMNELAHLGRDVETLIQVLIDIHLTNQMREVCLPKAYSDETGPMPVL